MSGINGLSLYLSLSAQSRRYGHGRDGISARKLFDHPSTDWSAEWPDGFDVTADGERFVMLRPVEDESNVQPVLVVVQNWYAEFKQD